MNSIENAPYYEAAKVGLTGQSDWVRWIDSRVIWHEQHGDLAVALAVMDSYGFPVWPLYLLLTRISDEWFPVEQASDTQWIPYNEGNSMGVFMQLTQCGVDTTEGVRIRLGSYELDAPKNDGHICIVIWDIDTDSRNLLEFTQVKVANHWVPCVTSSLPVNDAQFGDAYLNAGNLETHEWADSALRATEGSAERLKLVMSVVQQAHLPQHEKALGLLGAGPMEDLMSDWLLDRLEDYLPFEENLKYTLSMVRMDFEPDALQQRLNAMLAIR